MTFNRCAVPFLALLLLSRAVNAQDPPPKYEFRGAWIATVINLDWPSSPSLTTAKQQSDLIRILDELQDAGINAVMFQIRSEADAMYDSSLEPWSFWLTGQQGKAPDPYYDPLEFAVEEAKKRGMELHAWMNPFRADRQIGSYSKAASHVTRAKPEWLIQIGSIKVLNPGLPEVRAYIRDVVMDVINRYDVDGMHFDDYFYPYPPNQISNQDNSNFTADPRGFNNIRDWRRDNINTLIASIYDSIQTVKPFVKFGISPFGIWRNGVPFGITGLDAYDVIFGDALAWLSDETVDYVAPQLYWPFGGGQDYGKLLPWWASQAFARHLYVGQAAYRAGDWPSNEFQRQLDLNRENPDVQGSIFFRALNFRENPKGFTDLLRNTYHSSPAITPVLPWKETTPPEAPTALRYERIESVGTLGLAWDPPAMAADGDTARRYGVYRVEGSTFPADAIEDARNLVAIAGPNFSIPAPPAGTGSAFTYGVTALDRNSNESMPGPTLTLSAPAAPVLAAPTAGDTTGSPTVTLAWFSSDSAAFYDVQLATDSLFSSGVLLNVGGLVDTAQTANDLEGRRGYFWRARSSNAGGVSAFTAANQFFAGYPVKPGLSSPANHLRNQPLNLELAWQSAEAAASYDLQVATSRTFDSASLVAELTAVGDTVQSVGPLEADTFHYWRIRGANRFGSGRWSDIWRFRTGTTTTVEAESTGPEKFALFQNYPNPFNPRTTITVRVPRNTRVRLDVFDVLGRRVATLLEGEIARGTYTLPFDASQLASGIYYYRLVTPDAALTRKMLLVR